MDDALAKLQEIIDRAVEAVTPKEADPETVARVKKKWEGRGGRGPGHVDVGNVRLRVAGCGNARGRADPPMACSAGPRPPPCPTILYASTPTPPQPRSIKAGNERRLDAKKKDSKKKSERRRRDFD
jgi:hypothetical protein